MSWNSIQTNTIYLGGLIGPLASQTLVAVVPEIATTFEKSIQEASFVVTLYMVPFASIMLFSSAVVRFVKPGTVIRSAYAVTMTGSLLCFFASSWGVFLTGVVVMSLSNAFTLPILQIVLRQTVLSADLGRALGRYFAMQSLGNCAGPLVAGVASLVDWKLMHLAVVVLSLWMVLVGVPDSSTISSTERDEPLDWFAMLIHVFTILTLGMCIIGMSTVLTVHLDSVFGLDASKRGVIIMAGGLAAFFFAPRIGASIDRFGPLKIMTCCSILGAVAIAGMAFIPWAVVLAVLWGIAMSSAQGLQTTVTYSVLRTPGGAAFNSAVLAFRFFGLALTPIVLLPTYFHSTELGFALPATLILIALAAQWGRAKRAAR